MTNPSSLGVAPSLAVGTSPVPHDVNLSTKVGGKKGKLTLSNGESQSVTHVDSTAPSSAETKKASNQKNVLLYSPDSEELEAGKTIVPIKNSKVRTKFLSLFPNKQQETDKAKNPIVSPPIPTAASVAASGQATLQFPSLPQTPGQAPALVQAPLQFPLLPQTPAPVPVPAPVPAPAPAPVPAPSIDALRKKVKKDALSDVSSQKILQDTKTALIAQGYTVKFQAKLATNDKNQFKFEPFKLDADSDKTFYRIKVTYEVIAEKAGVKKVIPFSRTISTNATTIDDAINLAAKFKETVCELAENKITDKKFKKRAIEQRAFTFEFSRDAAGKIQSLQSIEFTHGGQVFQHALNSPNKYVYDLKSKSVKSSGDDVKSKLGQVLFVTEEEALLQKYGYIIGENRYSTFSFDSKGDKELLNHIKEIKEDIRKKEEEFERIKSSFIQDPVFKSLKKELKLNEQTKQILLDAEALAVGSEKLPGNQQNKVSQNLKNLFSLNKEVSKAQGRKQILKKRTENLKKIEKKKKPSKQDIRFIRELLVKYKISSQGNVTNQIKACQKATLRKAKFRDNQIKAKEKEREDIKQFIDKDQTEFSKRLNQLYKVNLELDSNYQKLKSLRESGELGSNAMDDVEKKRGQEVLKTISESSLEGLKKHIKRNKQVFEKISSFLSVHDLNPSNSNHLVVSDSAI